MRDNVLIKVYERGRLKETREGHNVFIDRGREWLSGMMSYASFGPDVPERNERVRYMGFGIGGVKQGALALADTGAPGTAYPPGEDPNATNGHQYDNLYPINPLITTLERPVRISGGTNPYSTADAADRWLLYNSPGFSSSHLSTTEATFHGKVDGGAGDIIYSSFTLMPLSEVGLFVDEAGADPLAGGTPYKPLVAYFTFGTILMTANLELELVWSVRF